MGRERKVHAHYKYSQRCKTKKKEKKMIAHVSIQLSNTDAVSHGTPIKSKHE